ncbi:MAG: L-histidine N(alpha)-methyltransferase [Cyanobacteriota bacterium]|nr:L-histidine N(alpha)-methyltransferase [Cyanobacteriota bacterium]
MPIRCPGKPIAEFYSIFSEAEISAIAQSLEMSREIPLKYSYKGQGAKKWDRFYLQHLVARWYRSSNPEVQLLAQNFKLIHSHCTTAHKLNILDVGAGNSYPVKTFVRQFHRFNPIERYIALDISPELLAVSEGNFKRWFPTIQFYSYLIDIEKSCIPKTIVDCEDENRTNIILHLGVTMGNHRNRIGVLKNFRYSMKKGDLLIVASEIGSNSQWNGIARGGFKYHVEQVYAGIKRLMAIGDEDCELVRKYDEESDSLVANIKFIKDYEFEFNVRGTDKKVTVSEGEEITIWRQHKYEISELLQEVEKAGLQLIRYTTNKYSSNIMVICEVADF